MKKTDFSTNAPGKVLKTPQGYFAFVPAPLPPNIAWSSKMLSALSRADRSVARLAEVGVAFPVPHVVVSPFMRKEAVLSSRIEGTRTSLQELFTYELGQLSFFEDPRDAHEVHNYVKALDYGLERLGSLPLSIRLIREIHAVLMRGVRGDLMTPGEMRRSQNWIGRPGAALEAARYVPPPADMMGACLSNLELFIHQDYDIPPLLRVGMIHYQFEAIHPFLDGNGRVGRLIITLLLVAWKLLSQPVLYLSDFIEANRQEYYDRLLAVSRRGEWEEWLIFFLDGVHNQADDASRRIILLQEIRSQYQARLSGVRGRDKLERVVDYLIGKPITSITQAQADLAMGSFTTIQRYFKKLESLNIIKELSGKKRNRLYCAERIFKIIEERS